MLDCFSFLVPVKEIAFEQIRARRLRLSRRPSVRDEIRAVNDRIVEIVSQQLFPTVSTQARVCSRTSLRHVVRRRSSFEVP
jgi:hypothetical protein